MRAVDIIRKKRDGGELRSEELASFVQGAVDGSWAPYQLSALLMAGFCRGFTPTEAAELTRLMTQSGRCVDLSDFDLPKVDKHSTGGVGDKTSLILAPLVAACGVLVPMMSGRGLGHTGGTLDKLESIPGFRVHLSEREFREALQNTGLAMMGQTADVAPADKTLYALRDATGTVENISLITASILSKKLAEGIDGLVMDVKCGHGAFMKTLPEARALAQSLFDVGTRNGLRVECLLTRMENPLGQTVGNALEVLECLEILRGNGPAELADLSIALAAAMLRLAGVASTPEQAEQQIRHALDSGAGLQRFRRMVEQQGGDPRIVDDPSRLPQAPRQMLVRAARSGYLQGLTAGSVGIAATVLGAGRDRVEDRVDPAVGLRIVTNPGAIVREGEPIFEVHYRDEWRLGNALPLLEEAIQLGEEPPASMPLLIEVLA